MKQRRTLTRRGRARHYRESINCHSLEEASHWGDVARKKEVRRDVYRLAPTQESAVASQVRCDGSTQKGRREVEVAARPMSPERKWRSRWRVPLPVGRFSKRRVEQTVILQQSTENGVVHGPSRDVPASSVGVAGQTCCLPKILHAS